ncbi:MAG: hypothetical protein AABO58_11295 [Acidobacteriota bacterium]
MLEELQIIRPIPTGGRIATVLLGRVVRVVTIYFVFASIGALAASVVSLTFIGAAMTVIVLLGALLYSHLRARHRKTALGMFGSSRLLGIRLAPDAQMLDKSTNLQEPPNTTGRVKKDDRTEMIAMDREAISSAPPGEMAAQPERQGLANGIAEERRDGVADFGTPQSTLEDTFQNLAAFLNSLDAEGETKSELREYLVIDCLNCGRNVAFRGRCPKCGARNWKPARANDPLAKQIKRKGIRRAMLETPNAWNTPREDLN